MSASQQQSSLNSGYTLGPNSTKTTKPTSEGTVGSTTAHGAGPHPIDPSDPNPPTNPSTSKYGPQPEDLDGEQMATLPEGKVYEAQLNKREKGGWGEEPSLTADLERKKKEQEGKREAIKEMRARGEVADTDGGSPRLVQSEDNSAV